MSKIPQIPRQGQVIKAELISEIIRWIKSIVPRSDNQTTQIISTDGGTIIKAFGTGGTKLVPVKLKTKVNYNTYTGDVYEDGLDLTATETDVNIRIQVINSGETIPGLNTESAIYPAWLQSWLKIGGDGTEREDYYTCQPEIIRG